MPLVHPLFCHTREFPANPEASPYEGNFTNNKKDDYPQNPPSMEITEYAFFKPRPDLTQACRNTLTYNKEAV